MKFYHFNACHAADCHVYESRDGGQNWKGSPNLYQTFEGHPIVWRPSKTFFFEQSSFFFAVITAPVMFNHNLQVVPFGEVAGSSEFPSSNFCSQGVERILFPEQDSWKVDVQQSGGTDAQLPWFGKRQRFRWSL